MEEGKVEQLKSLQIGIKKNIKHSSDQWKYNCIVYNDEEILSSFITLLIILLIIIKK